MKTVIVSSSFVSVELIAWQAFRMNYEGMTERILEMNRGLSELGLFLPIGTKVLIPDAPVGEPGISRTAVSLWD
jgi:phage tail protein X